MTDSSASTQSTTEQTSPSDATPQQQETTFTRGELAIYRYTDGSRLHLQAGVINGQGEETGTVSITTGTSAYNVPVAAIVYTADPVKNNAPLTEDATKALATAQQNLVKVQTMLKHTDPSDVGFVFSVGETSMPVSPELAMTATVTLVTQAKLQLLNELLRHLNSF